MRPRFYHDAKIGIVVGLAGLLFALTPFASELEARYGLDFFFSQRGPRKAPPEVVVVALDKQSARILKQAKTPGQNNSPTSGDEPDTWSRRAHARLLNTLSSRGASVVLFDLYFYKARQDSNEDAVFAQSIEDAGNVILGEWLDPLSEHRLANDASKTAPSIQIQQLLPPIPRLKDVALASAPFPLPKQGAVRQFWTFKPGLVERATLPFMALQAYALEHYDAYLSLLTKINPQWAKTLPQNQAQMRSEQKLRFFTQSLRLKFKQDDTFMAQLLAELEQGIGRSFDPQTRRTLKAAIKSFEGDSRTFNFYGGPGTITNLPYYRLLEETPASSNIAPAKLDLKNKVVFVGMMENLGTEKDTIEMVFSSQQSGEYFGVEAAATAFANLLRDDFIRPLPPIIFFALVLGWGMGMAWLLQKKRPLPALGAASAVYLFYGLASYTLFSAANLSLPILIPLFQSLLAYGLVLTQRDLDTAPKLEVLKRSITKLLPLTKNSDILEGKAEISPGGKMVEVTLLNTDLSGFTEMSEACSAEELHKCINTYFTEIHGIVAKQGGMVTDVAGDAMFALWEHGNTAESAHQKALVAALAIAHAERQSQTKSVMHTRIALHTGMVSLGFVGSNFRCDFRQVSSTGNIAERIQQFNKILNTQILASEAFVKSCPRVLARKVGPVLLKGSRHPIVLYEVMGLLEQRTQALSRQIHSFSAILEDFEKRQWQVAQDKIKQHHTAYPDDECALYYQGLIDYYLDHPPASTTDHRILKQDFDLSS